ncbi:MAG: tetratricopeptide repeat protein [candidate division WOR-3 bacterium]|nr:tetratricopeptide repeat protein [candidate division WOR-3 bacterium]
MFEIFAGKDPQKAYQRAQEYLREGKITSAIKVLEDNLTETEESFPLYLELARLYFENQQRAEAVETLKTAHTLYPARVDEIIGLLSDYFFRYTSIDAGDFLLQLYTSQEEYDELFKVLRAFNEREVKLLINRYEKLKQNIVAKKVFSKRDFENLIIYGTIIFTFQESKLALDNIEFLLETEGFQKQLLSWARAISRERFNDPYAALLLLKTEAHAGHVPEVLNQAQRIYEKFPDFIDPLLDTLVSIHPPQDLESTYTQFITELYVKKGDLDASLARLEGMLKKDPSKIDDVIKTLRELQRINPKNLKVLFNLADNLLNAGRISLAITEFDKILEIDPDQYQEVMLRYERAFEKEPNNPLVIQGLVNFYLKQRKIDEAVQVIDRAYKIDRGLLDEYLQNLNLILEQAPEHYHGLYLLGLCYSHKGEEDNAAIIFEKLLEDKKFDLVDKALDEILRIHPDNPVYLVLKAKTLINLNKDTEGFELLQKHINEENIITFVPILDTILNHKPELSKEILGIYTRFRDKEPVIFDIALARGYAYAGEYEKAVKKFEELLYREEEKDTAKRALIEVIKERPKAVPLLLTAARTFLKDGEIEIATQFFKTAQLVDPKAFFEIIDEFYDTLKAFPKDREVWILLIDTFFNRKLYDRVIEEAKRAIEVFGNQAQYFHLKLGQAYVESGNLSDGVRPLMLALDGDTDYSAEVISYLDKILAVDKSNVPAHFARGRALARAKRIDEAVEEYLLTARIVPARAEYVLDELKTLSAKSIANPKVIFAMGVIELNLKKYAEGIRHLVQACELDNALVARVLPLLEKLNTQMPSPLLSFNLARVYHLANLKSSAIKFFIEAQEKEPAFREPAITEMKRICSEEPQDVEARKGLAQIYLNYNNLEDALYTTEEVFNIDKNETPWVKGFLMQILSKNSNHIPSYYFLGRLFIYEENYSKAVEIYKKLAEIAPQEIPTIIETLSPICEKSDELIYYTGILYKEIGEFNRTVGLFKKIFDRNPEFADKLVAHLKEITIKNEKMIPAFLLLSEIYAFKKEYETAIEFLKKVEKLVPQRREEILLKKGLLYFEKGDINQTVALYANLLQEAKDRSVVYKTIKKIRDDYFNRRLKEIAGNSDEDRLLRADIYLSLNRIKDAEIELQALSPDAARQRNSIILKSKLLLKKNQPVDALEVLRKLPVDKETAMLYAEIYETLGAYATAAGILKSLGDDSLFPAIEKYERLAQERRLGRGRYLIEGRI